MADPDSKIQTARAPEGLRIYAVGDVHGRSDLFDRLAARVENDLRARPTHRAITVFLGDYVDRGADSRGVIDRLAEGRFPTPIVALRGNHEDMMMRFMADDDAAGAFLDYGGLMTLRSYGVEASEQTLRNDATRLRRELIARTPAAHRRFLEDTAVRAEYGDYFFCHAGVRPGTPLESQSPDDLMYIRWEFLDHAESFGKVVVHGHTPRKEPERLHNRINVDTAAYRSGVLTAVALEDCSCRFLGAV